MAKNEENKAWQMFMDEMDERLFSLLEGEFGKNFEYDPWDHGDGFFDIQLWLPDFCGTVEFRKSNQDHQIAYIDTALNNEYDIDAVNPELLNAEAVSLNMEGKYKFEVVNDQILYLMHEITLQSDLELAAREVFQAVLQINNWSEQWYNNEWPKISNP